MRKKKKHKVVIYCRMSDRPDADTNESCKKQEEILRQFAKNEGLDVRGVFHDNAVSGSVHDDIKRPAIWDAIECARPGDVIAFRDAARLARDQMARFHIWKACKAKKLKVYISQGELWPERDPQSKLLFEILSAVAAYERDIIRERTRAVMRSHQRKGRAMGGKPPYGWEIRMESGHKILHPVEKEQRWLRLIIGMYLEGASYRAIVKALDEKGSRQRNGNKWHPQQIHRLCRRYELSMTPDITKFKPPVYHDEKEADDPAATS